MFSLTAEICIMNKLGVALAADSAVSLGGTSKVYNSANKLFALSKVHPVGIMIYGSSNYMGIPWETLIKLYRNTLGSNSFDSLTEYGKDFIKFLAAQKSHIIEDDINKHIESNLTYFFESLVEHMKEVLVAATAPLETLNPQQIDKLSKEFIAEELENLNSIEFVPNFGNEDVSIIINKYNDLFDTIFEGIFGENITNDEMKVDQLKEIGASHLLKNFGDSQSGVVITGYGEKEIYPSLCSYIIDGMFNDKIKYVLEDETTIGKKHLGAIFPFAQTNMVHTFISGIDPNLLDFILEENYQQTLNVVSLVKSSLDEIDEITQETKENIISKIINSTNPILTSFAKNTIEFRQTEFIEPLLSIVRSLPKEELAEMAETLVNLSSFKRKVSSSIESIGGPIDVMLITKGDGLIWIKRKHYFKADFNHDFFFNKYGINTTLKD